MDVQEVDEDKIVILIGKTILLVVCENKNICLYKLLLYLIGYKSFILFFLKT